MCIYFIFGFHRNTGPIGQGGYCRTTLTTVLGTTIATPMSTNTPTVTPVRGATAALLLEETIMNVSSLQVRESDLCLFVCLSSHVYLPIPNHLSPSLLLSLSPSLPPSLPLSLLPSLPPSSGSSYAPLYGATNPSPLASFNASSALYPQLPHVATPTLHRVTPTLMLPNVNSPRVTARGGINASDFESSTRTPGIK